MGKPGLTSQLHDNIVRHNLSTTGRLFTSVNPDLKNTEKPMSQNIPETQADVSAEIINFFDRVTEMRKQGATVQEVADAFYWDDLIITGEGSDIVHKSKEEFLPDLALILEQLGTDCGFHFNVPMALTQDMAAVFTQMSCNCGDGTELNFRVLYVLEKRAGEWKVVRESYTEGVIE